MNHSRAVIPVLYIALLAAWPLAGLGRENRSLPADAAAPAFAPAPASQGVRDGATIWWAPQFEYDSKNALLTYTFDNEGLQKAPHRLKLTVTDRCGNQSEIILTVSG